MNRKKPIVPSGIFGIFSKLMQNKKQFPNQKIDSSNDKQSDYNSTTENREFPNVPIQFKLR